MPRKRKLKISGKYQKKQCKQCGLPFILGPLDPDVDYCPVCAYGKITDAVSVQPFKKRKKSKSQKSVKRFKANWKRSK
jgi:uncharacterized Zn finger protein (UPF0148 family)